MSRTPFLSALALALALALGTGLWWTLARPVALPDVPGGRLECVSFTPYEGDENPNKQEFRVSEEVLRLSLAALKPVTGCIRLYSAIGTFPDVVRIADEMGIKVILGLWIGTKDTLNAREISSALSLARAYPNTVTMLMVGNEVLLRREMSGARLAGIIRSVKEQAPVPVGYADVPDFWRANREVAQAVDVVAVHILPYWDDPVAPPVERAQAVVHNLTGEFRATFPGKKILIGEIGWPSDGRTRGHAVPSRVNEARFVREFAAWANANGAPYNLIEGLDQPWKRVAEGTVGGFWGILAEDLTPKFPLAGPVSEWPEWPWAAGLTGAASFLLLAWAAAFRPRTRPAGWLALALLGPALGATLAALVRLFATIPRDWMGATGIGLLFVFTVGGAALAALHLTGGGPLADTAPARFADILVPARRSHRAAILAAGQWAVALSAAMLALALAAEGRHRDFLPLGYWLPALGFAAQAWRTRATTPADRREEAWVALVLAVSGVASIEGLANLEALVWAAVCVVLAAPWLPACAAEARRLARRLFQADQPQQAE